MPEYLKRILRKPFATLIVIVVFSALAVLMNHLQSSLQSRQESLLRLSEETEIWCVLANRITGQTNHLNASYQYAQGSYYDQANGMSTYMSEVRIVTQMDGVHLSDNGNSVVFAAVNSMDAWLPLRDASVSIVNGRDVSFLNESTTACLISEDLLGVVSNDHLSVLMPSGATLLIEVAGTIAGLEHTIVVPWQAYRDVYAYYGFHGQSLDEFSFLLADNSQLTAMQEAFHEMFAIGSASSANSSEILLINDFQYQKCMLHSKRNLFLLELLRPVLVGSIIIVGAATTSLLLRTRQWEHALMISLGRSIISIMLQTLLEITTGCCIGVAMILTLSSTSVASLTLLLLAFLFGALISLLLDLTKPVLRHISHREV